MKKWSIIAVLTSLVILISGCTISIGGNGIEPLKGAKIIDTQNEKKVIEVDNSKKVNLDLTMGIGILNLKGGSDKLLDGELIYNVKEWTPVINYTKSGDEGELEIKQPPSNVNNLGNKIKYEWNLKLNDKIPMDIEAEMGVGKSDLDFSNINLEKLELQLGVGETKLDLSGSYNHDVDIKIDGGVGSITLYLPKTMNVKLNVQKGVGALDVEGLTKDGSNYTFENPNSKNTMTLNIETGVGAVKIRQK